MTEHKTVTILPSGDKIRVNPGESLLGGLNADVPIRADCGGKGICGKCSVILERPDQAAPTESEKDLIAENRIDAGWRLACQVSVHTDMEIRLPKTSLDQEPARGKAIAPGPYNVYPKARRSGALGLAVDIGTTTVASYLCDLRTGVILASASSINPQRRFGLDIVNRVQAASSREGLKQLRSILIDAVICLAHECLSSADLAHKEAGIKDIESVVIVGNTAMQYIFAGINPAPLVQAPYEPESHKAMELPADDLGPLFSASCRTYVMPVISGFAGGDIVACVLAENLLEKEETTLIVDIGTNGELILKSRESVWATSCATGPAFEGALISCGMRAVDGAVSSCRYDAVKKEFVLETVGQNASPLGLCGSGVIEAVHALRKAGMVDESGRMIPQETSTPDRISLISGSQKAGDVNVYLTQKDIRQVQLAKAALATGIVCLLEKAGIRKVDRTVLTGAFGHAFNWQKASEIGMLPDLWLLGRIESRANLAGQGGVMALLDETQRKTAEKIQEKAAYIHLADDAGFIRQFVTQTLFP